MKPEQAKALREPFAPAQIGKRVVGGGFEADYVGHAATTDRLLSVDPEWTWEPMAVDALGNPVMAHGGMWILLTVHGVTRPGYGDGKNPKEIIGDAIRNAAMRFGVALDLWAKEDLREPPKATKEQVADIGAHISILVADGAKRDEIDKWMLNIYGTTVPGDLGKREAGDLLAKLVKRAESIEKSDSDAEAVTP